MENTHVTKGAYTTSTKLIFSPKIKGPSSPVDILISFSNIGKCSIASFSIVAWSCLNHFKNLVPISIGPCMYELSIYKYQEIENKGKARTMNKSENTAK
jgi:hypothetical protein